MFVCLNMFVIFLMCGGKEVKVVHFVLFSAYLFGVASLLCVVFAVLVCVVK